MAELTIKTKSKAYPVYIGKNIFQEVELDLAAELSTYSKVFVLTDQHVADLYLDKIEHLLASNENVVYYVTPNGEEAKTFAVYEDIITKAIEAGLDRKSVLLAFGGGVIGDLGGFVAATYMRGIPFYQIPTTILAHDSAVGGKVAINHSLGKNMVGVFYQPEAVIYDTFFLTSLPIREIRSGFAELIKHALISSASLLEELMKTYQSEADFYEKDMTPFLLKGIQVKAEIVAKDEREESVRAFLNFGHTFGHALEAYGNYGRWLHGEAVIYGMMYALHMSKIAFSLPFDLDRFIGWLKGLGYITELPQDVSFNEIYQHMYRDKKTTFAEIKMVLLHDIGQVDILPIQTELAETTFDQMERGGN
ncbi:3-dehydroquinate synthase [Listeria sp. PSOL-1]|uniref:3-dehydroquinate synthase n=1 Tax=Listeria sp. PSOL-1 TaxID=1844999 RepID=UPI0013D067D9|nr:3-dehydroquinate synthase [Listeria sp. PSOL-1]